jgi:hypothetical protein
MQDTSSSGPDTTSPVLALEASSSDRFVTRARPGFLYVIYVMLLAALPVGVLAAFRPDLAAAVSRGVGAYLGASPEPLYTLFGAGYLGYTAARQWGKIAGSGG